MIIPVVIAVARAAGISPLPPALGATLGASLAFMLPVATPPNAIVYGSGRIRILQMIRAGVLYDLLGVGVVLLLLRISVRCSAWCEETEKTNRRRSRLVPSATEGWLLRCYLKVCKDPAARTFLFARRGRGRQECLLTAGRSAPASFERTGKVQPSGFRAGSHEQKPDYGK